MIRLIELLLESIPGEVYFHQIPNPNYGTGSKFKKTVTVGYALRQPRTSALYRVAKNYLTQYLTQQHSSPTKSTNSTTSVGSDSGASNSPRTNNAPSISQERTEEIINDLRGLYRRGTKIGLTKHASLDDFLASDERRALEESLKEYPGNITLAHVLSMCIDFHNGFADASGIKPNKMAMSFKNDKNKLILSFKAIKKPTALEFSGQFVLDKSDASKSYFNGETLILDTQVTQVANVGKKGSGEIIKRMISQCDSMGVTTIEFYAAMRAGGFKWAQIGGLPIMTPEGISGMYVMNDITKKFDNVLDWAENNTWPEWQFDEKTKRQVTNIITKLKQNGELEFTMELIKSCIEGLNNGDPQFLSIIANTPLGRFLLSETAWRGIFDITPGSETREIIETHM
jgi:hypothetical protein